MNDKDVLYYEIHITVDRCFDAPPPWTWSHISWDNGDDTPGDWIYATRPSTLSEALIKVSEFLSAAEIAEVRTKRQKIEAVVLDSRHPYAVSPGVKIT